MIKIYNYFNTIKKSDENKAIQLVDNLIKCGEYAKEEGYPKFQTYADLHTFEEFKIFFDTFKLSCMDYLNVDYFAEIKMWCFRDNIFSNLKKNQSDQWHKHSNLGENSISGVYYLKNPKKEGTEFKNFKINPKSFSWHLYPSHMMHKPPKIKSFKNRYTIAADFTY